ncbi:WS/DGAT/MGAT family O-acyltransferase [Blastococcus sp. SYSU D00820]
MDRLSPTDAGFYYAESENTPLHVGSVAVFEGPAPTYGEIIRLLLSKLPLVPRYRQRVRPVPMQLGRPLWVDDPHFQILYHVRHTAVPSPGSEEQLRNLAGRVLGQRLDLAKPLWELWLVEGLENGRWAIISKVHHCMVDGVAGTDLMQLMFDLTPDAKHSEPQDWTPQRSPSSVEIVAGAVQEAITEPLRQLTHTADVTGSVGRLAKGAVSTTRSLLGGIPTLARQLTTPVARSLSGPIGPHRRWAWTEAEFDELKGVRTALGGTVNDVVLAAITRGFRDLLERRGSLRDGLVVRSMVPISMRQETERNKLDNRITAVFVDLPVAEPDPAARLASVRRQMDEYKSMMQLVDARSIIAMGDFVAPTLLSLGVRAALGASQFYSQAVTTNVPGPRVPLYVLGRRMCSAHAYVPIAGGTRVSIGIFSYLNTMTFGINADFDGFPDIDVLAGGIRRGLDELKELAATAGAERAAAAGSGEKAAASGGEKAAPSGGGQKAASGGGGKGKKAAAR